MTEYRQDFSNYRKRNIFVKVFRFYVEGFKNMTVGKTLWIIILAKLFIMFIVLRLFFFKPVLSGKSETEKERFVAEQLLKMDSTGKINR
ncbi:MAG: DUF4492 domain-containing protein [Bacteroidales bacterium]|jgi:hypothetical protein|nr:DUF4492 domain-containing protein [Bacteroidales bacterium]